MRKFKFHREGSVYLITPLETNLAWFFTRYEVGSIVAKVVKIPRNRSQLPEEELPYQHVEYLTPYLHVRAVDVPFWMAGLRIAGAIVSAALVFASTMTPPSRLQSSWNKYQVTQFRFCSSIVMAVLLPSALEMTFLSKWSFFSVLSFGMLGRKQVAGGPQYPLTLAEKCALNTVRIGALFVIPGLITHVVFGLVLYPYMFVGIIFLTTMPVGLYLVLHRISRKLWQADVTRYSVYRTACLFLLRLALSLVFCSAGQLAFIYSLTYENGYGAAILDDYERRKVRCTVELLTKGIHNAVETTSANWAQFVRFMF